MQRVMGLTRVAALRSLVSAPGCSCVVRRAPAIVCRLPQIQQLQQQQTRHMSRKHESDEEFDARYLAYLNRKEIDGWEVRKAMNDIMMYDLIPEPKIISAALQACRRLNEFALTVRFLEAVKWKANKTGNKDIWAYIQQEIQPTLDELGIPTPEQLGYNKPELFLLPADEAYVPRIHDRKW